MGNTYRRLSSAISHIDCQYSQATNLLPSRALATQGVQYCSQLSRVAQACDRCSPVRRAPEQRHFYSWGQAPSFTRSKRQCLLCLIWFGSRDHFAHTTIPSSSSSASSLLSPPKKNASILIYVSLLHQYSLFKYDFIGLNRCYQAHTHTHPLPCPIPLFTTTNLCRTAIKRYKG